MRDLESLIHQTLHHVIAKDLMPMEKRQTVEQTLLDREKKVSMAIGNATAVPHAYPDVLMIHVLIGASLLMLPWLREVPMAVLYGFFLFMGIVSMKGNQLSERLGLWFMDRGLYPSTHYTRRSPMSTIHGFTALQFGVVVVLWMVKVNSLAILFPVFIAAAVPMGMLAGRLFAPQHLAALDAEEEPDEEEPHWSGQQDCRPYRSRIAANLRQSSPSPGKTATESGHRGQEQGNQGSSIDEDTWPRCNWSNGVNMSHSTETPISCQPHLLERK